MISPEVLRRYPFFARLNTEQLNTLAKLADEESVDTDHYFFREEQELSKFYLQIEGATAMVFELPERDVEHKISDQFMRELKTRDVVISTIGPGDLFGWSGLVPPHCANAGAKALTPGRVIVFDSKKLLDEFDEDPRFGYLMIQRAAQTISARLTDLRIETLAYITE